MPPRPTGTAFIHRFRRLKRFEEVKAEDDPRRIWIDVSGRPHVFVDVRGVIYLTGEGLKLLGRRRRRLEASSEVNEGGLRQRWMLAARLRRGHHMLGRHVVEVLENRRELQAAPGVSQDLSPNHPILREQPP